MNRTVPQMSLDRRPPASRRSLLLACLCLLALPACVAPRRGGPDDARERWAAPGALPDVPREFRAAWIATVANVDWPSRPGLPPALQRSELRAILDRCSELGLNAVVFQVRPHGDALYPSDLEPWSAYLTGVQGRPPEPVYDPLQFAIDEAHARGLELHAWFNPFRASHPSDKSPRDGRHFATRYPEHVVTYGSYTWMDPSSEAVQAHALDVIADVVRRYDIDGVHMDDYFYPYPIQERRQTVPFPDDRAFAAYRQGGGSLDRAAWRRENVDRFVEQLHRRTKELDPQLRVGISPFGIWRPGHPPSVQGLDAYDAIYADARKWLQKGWVDYLAPQLYWSSTAPKQGFAALMGWWVAQSTEGRPIWPGLAAHRAGDAAKGFGAGELSRQIETARAFAATTPGFFLFSARQLMDPNGPAAADLGGGTLTAHALPPALGTGAAAPRLVATASADAALLWVHADRAPDAGVRWVVQFETAAGWHHHVVPPGQGHVRIPHGGDVPVEVWVRAIDDQGHLGPPTQAEVVVLTS